MGDKDVRTERNGKGRKGKGTDAEASVPPPGGAGLHGPSFGNGSNGKARGRERKEVQQLIEKGRTKGFLTYDEVNDALPPEMVTSDQIDDLMMLVGDGDIEVVA